MILNKIPASPDVAQDVSATVDGVPADKPAKGNEAGVDVDRVGMEDFEAACEVEMWMIGTSSYRIESNSKNSNYFSIQ